ncbi:hypothetical protein ACYOEI_05110 [Singulisphaera rosea]
MSANPTPRQFVEQISEAATFLGERFPIAVSMLQDLAKQLAPMADSAHGSVTALTAAKLNLGSPQDAWSGPEDEIEPEIRPTCCVRARQLIQISTDPLTGQAHGPDDWCLHLRTTGVETTFAGEPVVSSGGFVEIGIEYCPFCGERLESAWVE